MTQLPTHTQTAAQAAIAGDAADMLSDWNVPAIYRRGGSGNGSLVYIRVTPSSKQSRTMSGRGVQPSNQHTQQTTTVMVLADPNGSDLGLGVTEGGKVIQLKKNDTFVVSGSEVGREDDQVTLLVKLEVSLVERSYWTAEVSL